MASQPDLAIAPQPIPIQRAAAAAQPTLADLLQYEGELRRLATVAELVYFVANETRRIIDHDQLFILRQPRLGDAMRVEAVSSMAVVERHTPLIQAIEKRISALSGTSGSTEPVGFEISVDEDGQGAFADYPFHCFHWHPLKDRDGQIFAGLLLARSAPLDPTETVRLERVGETVAHGWCALTANRPVNKIAKIGPRERKGMLVLASVIALFPVQMTALAPVEVVAARPFVITAPISGVISTIDVSPNAPVRQGQLLMRFDDIKFRNEQSVAAQKSEVAEARVERSTTAAFDKAEEAREIGINQAEAQVASADLAYARDMMAKTRVIAPKSGIALYTDRKDWEGRAVNVGEPIMQVADPESVALRIDLPARAQMALEKDARVTLWLDSQPFWAIDARLQTASYQARQTPEGVLAFALTAKPVGARPRIGSRGTAKVYGGWAPFAYTILKRPIASLRQYIGF
jgi:Barrel-sandwich domain of CusB or HlyD membrane-fusion